MDLAYLLTHSIDFYITPPWPVEDPCHSKDLPRPSRIREPRPIPVAAPIPGVPIHLISMLPTSLYVHLVPFPRSYPGRSLLFSRVDDHHRLRFAVGLSQWGDYGEEMELWIHHTLFYVVQPSRRSTFQHSSGGIVEQAGLIVIPLPKLDKIRDLVPIKLIVEVSFCFMPFCKYCLYCV